MSNPGRAEEQGRIFEFANKGSEVVLDHSILVITEREYKSLYDWCQLVSHHVGVAQ
jgi:hypothetical protein